MRHEKYAVNNLTTKGEKKNNNCNTLRTNSNIWKNSLSSTWLENYSIKTLSNHVFQLIVVDFKTSFSAGKKVAKLNNFSFPERKLHAQLTVNHFFFKAIWKYTVTTFIIFSFLHFKDASNKPKSFSSFCT